jgi:hypothetical protein
MRFYLQTPDQPRREVSREEWIRAERAAGFRLGYAADHPSYWDTCATAGFLGKGYQGDIVEYADNF